MTPLLPPQLGQLALTQTEFYLICGGLVLVLLIVLAILFIKSEDNRH